jgi:hypothetical protein
MFLAISSSETIGILTAFNVITNTPDTVAIYGSPDRINAHFENSWISGYQPSVQHIFLWNIFARQLGIPCLEEMQLQSPEPEWESTPARSAHAYAALTTNA